MHGAAVPRGEVLVVAKRGDAASGEAAGKRRKRTPQGTGPSDSVVFAIYTHGEERERYRALADRLKVTHGELLTLLLDMTEELLDSGRLEVRFKTVTVRKTMPEYVLKPAPPTE